MTEKTTHHTPGPWGTYFSDGELTICQMNGDEPIHLIAVASMTRHEWEANALLISAAPDLLEACASVWCALADTDDPVLKELATECDKAIAKAKREYT